MGEAALIFEPCPPNFENQYNFWRCLNGTKIIFDIFTSFIFSEISVECPVHSWSLSLPNSSELKIYFSIMSEIDLSNLLLTILLTQSWAK